MKHRLFTLVVGLTTLATYTSPVLANQMVADTMNLLAEQMQALVGFSKAPVEPLVEKDFARLTSRTRGARILLNLLSEKKGEVDAAGKLVATAFTPDALVGKEGTELETLLKQYETANQEVAAAFGLLETELNIIAKADPKARDLTAYKAALKTLNTALMNAHNAFKPKKPTP